MSKQPIYNPTWPNILLKKHLMSAVEEVRLSAWEYENGVLGLATGSF